MNQNAFFRIFFFIALVVIIGNSSAEIRSGFWTRTIPSALPGNAEVDFSELSPFCRNESAGETVCGLVVADCRYSLDNRGITAPNGILFDSTLDAKLRELLEGKEIVSDWKTLFYLDSMMKKIELAAPEEAYVDSLPVGKEHFFIRTDEGHYALMVKVDEYIGGLDRVTYYWVYNSAGENRLYKKNLITVAPAMTLTVGLDVFSGRVNPVFTVSDSAAISQLVHAIYLSVNSLFDTAIISNDTASCHVHLGYRSLLIHGMIVPFSRWESYRYSFTLCGGKLCLITDPVTSVEPLKEYYLDVNSRLEKEIIRICCSLDLATSTETGPVHFCEVIPDSLKTGVVFSGGRMSDVHTAEHMPYQVSSGQGIHFRNDGGCITRIELINLQGRCFRSIESGTSTNGGMDMNLRKSQLNAGFYLLRIRIRNQLKIVPVIIP